MHNQPVLTVVTVTCNASSSLERTILSVQTQTLRSSIEYLLIDGGSTDGTLDIVRKYADRLDGWTSEPDRGIYDAMNKGVARARGEWILFLNAGDVLCAPDTLERLGLAGRADFDLVYGDCQVDYGAFTVTDRALPPEALPRRMICSHQSLFTRTALLKECGFDASYSIAADFELICRMQAGGRRFLRLGQVVSRVQAMGVSGRRLSSTLAEQRRAALAHFPLRRTELELYFAARLAGARIKKVAKSLMPASLMRRVLALKYGGARHTGGGPA